MANTFDTTLRQHALFFAMQCKSDAKGVQVASWLKSLGVNLGYTDTLN